MIEIDEGKKDDGNGVDGAADNTAAGEQAGESQAIRPRVAIILVSPRHWSAGSVISLTFR